MNHEINLTAEGETNKARNAKAPYMTQAEAEAFFVENRKLIHQLLKPYKGCDEYDDLYQEASIGFFKGLQTYQEGKNTKLTTYACECAKNQVKMHLRRINAKFRTATVVSLEYSGPQGSINGAESNDVSPFLNKDFSETDTLHQPEDSLEESLYKKDIMKKALAIIDNEMPYEHRIVLYRYFEGVSQSRTAKELHSSQASISKIQKSALASLIVTMKNRGIIAS